MKMRGEEGIGSGASHCRRWGRGRFALRFRSRRAVGSVRRRLVAPRPRATSTRTPNSALIEGRELPSSLSTNGNCPIVANGEEGAEVSKNENSKDDESEGSASNNGEPSSFDALLRDLARPEVKPPPIDLVGKSLAHFRVRAKLGQGGMGVVYLATDEKLKRDVALKVLPATAETSTAQRQRFLREARAAAAITHACIATVYEIGEAEGHAFIAMELVKGTTLRERIAAGLSIVESVRIARDVARGLAKAHERGVVHRDLKPENVMLTHEGEVKILDFGIAKMWEAGSASGGDDALADTVTPETGPVTALGHVMGTPAYMSPEQARGERVDVRSDVFSFGAMLYEMVCGARPFQGEIGIAVLYAVIDTEPVPVESRNSEVPTELAKIVMTCLAKERDKRFASGRELSAALTSWISNEESRASELRASGRSSVSPDIVVRPSGAALVSGEGTELAATVTPESLVANVTPASASPPAKRESGVQELERASLRGEPPPGDRVAKYGRRITPRVLLALLVLLLAIPVAFVVHKSVDPHPPITTASASASAPASAVVVIPLGATNPVTSNPEAMKEYRQAIGDWHDARSNYIVHLERAVELDPEFAAASLRVLFGLLQPASTKVYEDVARYRDRLDARDRDFLEAEAPLHTRIPADVAETERRYNAILARRPGDLEALLRLGYIQTELLDRPEAALRTYRTAAALDPTLALALSSIAKAEADEGHYESAQRTLDDCNRVSPGATRCVAGKAELDARTGDCKSYFDGTRTYATIGPDDQYAAMRLTAALMASGHDRGEVNGQIAHLRGLSAGNAHWLADVMVFQSDVWFGAFKDARMHSDKAQDGGTDFAALILDVEEEVGEEARVTAVVRKYIAQRATTEQRSDDMPMLQWLLPHHVMTREQATNLRDRWRAEAARNPGWQPRWLWLLYDTVFVSTREEAEEVLSRPEASGIGHHLDPDWSLPLGKLLSLAGRAAEARVYFAEASADCRIQHSQLSSSYIATTVRASYELGRTSEELHDVPAACAAYQRVEDRWGNATPRSTTAEKARARMTAIHCAAP